MSVSSERRTQPSALRRVRAIAINQTHRISSGLVTVPYKDRVIDVTTGALADGGSGIISLGVWDTGRHAYVALHFNRSMTFDTADLALAAAIRLAMAAIDDRRV